VPRSTLALVRVERATTASGRARAGARHWAPRCVRTSSAALSHCTAWATSGALSLVRGVCRVGARSRWAVGFCLNSSEHRTRSSQRCSLQHDGPMLPHRARPTPSAPQQQCPRRTWPCRASREGAEGTRSRPRTEWTRPRRVNARPSLVVRSLLTVPVLPQTVVRGPRRKAQGSQDSPAAQGHPRGQAHAAVRCQAADVQDYL
jgi:hypothetical protein